MSCWDGIRINSFDTGPIGVGPAIFLPANPGRIFLTITSMSPVWEIFFSAGIRIDPVTPLDTVLPADGVLIGVTSALASISLSYSDFGPLLTGPIAYQGILDTRFIVTEISINRPFIFWGNPSWNCLPLASRNKRFAINFGGTKCQQLLEPNARRVAIVTYFNTRGILSNSQSLSSEVFYSDLSGGFDVLSIDKYGDLITKEIYWTVSIPIATVGYGRIAEIYLP